MTPSTDLQPLARDLLQNWVLGGFCLLHTDEEEQTSVVGVLTPGSGVCT